MAPDTVIGLAPHLRAGLHLAAWIDAELRPSLMPTVPRLPKGASATDALDVMDIQRYRDALDRALFPEDADG